MTPNINIGCVARSFAFGLITLFFSTSLVACGPGPDESASPNSQSFAQGEPSFDLVPVEREHGPLRSTQRKDSNDLLNQ